MNNWSLAILHLGNMALRYTGLIGKFPLLLANKTVPPGWTVALKRER